MVVHVNRHETGDMRLETWRLKADRRKVEVWAVNQKIDLYVQIFHELYIVLFVTASFKVF